MFGRIMDLWARPITGTPGAYVNVMIQSGQENSVVTRQLQLTGEVRRVSEIKSDRTQGSNSRHSV